MQSPLRALSPGSSLSSYDFFSYTHDRSQAHSRAPSSGESASDSYASIGSDDGSSDDEILLSFSDLSDADFRSQRGEPRTPAIFSDDEFVLMSRPRSPASDEDDLTTSFSALSMGTASPRSSPRRRHRRAVPSTPAQPRPTDEGESSPKRRNRKRRAAAGAQAPGNALPPDAPPAGKGEPAGAKHHSPSKARRNARRAAARAAAASPTPSYASTGPAAGLGNRSVVDDVSEAGTECLYIPPELYKSAQRYVSSYVAPLFFSCSRVYADAHGSLIFPSFVPARFAL